MNPQMSQMDADKGEPRTYAIIGAAMEVHGALGHGFLEAVYHAALAIEFERQALPFLREAPLTISYKGHALPCGYRADFLCFGTIIVELKALARLSSVEIAQVLNYLKASSATHALLLKFGAPRLEYKRLILSDSHLRTSASSADN